MKQIQELPIIMTRPSSNDALAIDSGGDGGTQKITYDQLLEYAREASWRDITIDGVALSDASSVIHLGTDTEIDGSNIVTICNGFTGAFGSQIIVTTAEAVEGTVTLEVEYGDSESVSGTVYYRGSAITKLNSGSHLFIISEVGSEDVSWEVVGEMDTTYDDMVGASALEEGVRGLVPAPNYGEQSAYLRGDGTWEIPASGLGTLVAREPGSTTGALVPNYGFTSADTSLTPSATESVELLANGDNQTTILHKISQMFKNVRFLMNNSQEQTSDSQNMTVSFTSSDVTDPSTVISVERLTSGETHRSIFTKVSQMFSNIRYLLSMLGTTDISTIGNGTVTGAINTLSSGGDIEEYSATLPSTFSAGSFNIHKRGAVVMLNMRNVTKATTGTNLLLTLPEGWRPIVDVSAMVESPTSDVNMRLVIRPNGQVEVYNYKSTAISGSTNAYATLTYLAA